VLWAGMMKDLWVVCWVLENGVCVLRATGEVLLLSRCSCRRQVGVFVEYVASVLRKQLVWCLGLGLMSV
jgi:hypothetical protein